MTNDKDTIGNAFHYTLPPEWALSSSKPILRQCWDFVGAPLRMIALPDRASENLGFTSLRAERLRHVLPQLRGRVLDIGCGDNMLLKLYNRNSQDTAAKESVGADVHKWTDDVYLISNSSDIDFPDCSFDTVSFVACLNHIPERAESLLEANRLLRPGGRVVVTMIGRFLGKIGHALWWYSEDKERELHPDELMGMDPSEIKTMLSNADFELKTHQRFCYNMNSIFVAEKK